MRLVMGLRLVRQKDSMQCGIACMAMICRHFGRKVSLAYLESICRPSREGVSLKAMSDLCGRLGMECRAGKVTPEGLRECPLPCVLHWNQNHFVVLYRISRDGRRFHIADPAKGKYRLDAGAFREHWVSVREGNAAKGIAMFFSPTDAFRNSTGDSAGEQRSLRFLARYLLQYRRSFALIFAGLLLGSVLQLILPFLTQWTVDIGIRHQDIGLIWLILLGELMIVAGRTATDFIRRWMLLHISMRVNVSLVSDFFVKLLRLPMSFFDTRLMGDLLQRIGDHSRVQDFLTGRLLGVVFSLMNFAVFGIVLAVYDLTVFGVFAAGSACYAVWIAAFLRRRKVLDYQLFEQQAKNQNRTYQFITSMQEIKLQGCERRRRWEWEDTQADLFAIQLRSLRLQQTQEAGSIFINEVKNILITVFAATNALDAENERAIVENLGGFYRGRTVVVVAHRLSTVRNADRIIVVDGGRVVETGDQASLTARRGAYYNLVRNQLELGT